MASPSNFWWRHRTRRCFWMSSGLTTVISMPSSEVGRLSCRNRIIGKRGRIITRGGHVRTPGFPTIAHYALGFG